MQPGYTVAMQLSDVAVLAHVPYYVYSESLI